MMSSCQSLPGIRRIAYTDCDNLPYPFAQRAAAGEVISLAATGLTEVTLSGEPRCEAQRDFDNNSSVEKVTLTFRTLDDIPAGQPIAFVAFAANGQCWVIGASGHPYPVVMREKASGLPDGDPAVCEYQVSLTAKKALAPCRVS